MATVLAASTLATLGAGEVFAAYYQSCGLSDNNYHGYESKQSIATAHMVADVTYLRAMHQCTAFSFWRGQAYTFPVNIQNSTYPNFCAVQLGWGQTDQQTTNVWFITANDTSCSLSTPANWPPPVVGHHYHFDVNGGVLTGYWRYLLTDVTLGTTYPSALATRHVAAGDSIWSGFEVAKNEDQFGGAGTSQNIVEIGYYQPSTTLIYLTPGNSTLSSCCGSRQTYWHTTESTDGDGNVVLHGYTDNH